MAIDKNMANYFETVSAKVTAKTAANWIINELKIDGLLIVEPAKLIELIETIETGTISGKTAKDVLVEMMESGRSAAEIIAEKGLKQIGGEDEIAIIVDKVISENSAIVESIKAGKASAIGFLVGQVMRESKGQANPGLVNKILKEKIR